MLPIFAPKPVSMFDFSIGLNLGFWVPLLAILCSAGVFGAGSYFFMAMPAEVMEKYGYSSPASTPMWATLVSFMRVLGTVGVNLTLIFLFFLYEAFSHGWVSKWSLFVCLMFNGGILAAAAYRVYAEDVKSTNNSDASVTASKKNVMLFGGLSGLIVLGFFFEWLWGPTEGNYVNDALHGLPDDLSFSKELSLMRTSTARFLKQTVLGHS